MPANSAKVFMTGRSQAIRLPKKFRLNTREVYIKREEENLIITPKPEKTWAEFFTVFEPCPDFELYRDNPVLPEGDCFDDIYA
jgi:antitoxin VapB